MNYDITQEYDKREDAAIREENARRYLELEARLPRSRYPLERLSSTRLITWWHRARELWRDCHQLYNHTTGYTQYQIRDLRADCALLEFDIEEVLKARGYVRWADNSWHSAEDDKYQRWLEGLNDHELKVQHELSEWDEGRDER
jgi:hypothetical protein